jgi:FKBP-type peptidyl-prolyl cis-trans isomerase FklB
MDKSENMRNFARFLKKESMDKLSYALGLGIGQQLAQMGVGSDFNVDDFAQSIKDVMAGNELKVSHREAQQIVQDYFAKQEAKMNAERAEKGKAAREEGEKYLAENAKKDGIVTLPSGLQYQVLREGNGKKPSAKDSVKCHYEGFLIDGTVFDSSVQRGEPAVFGLQQVIAGWTEGLQLMQEGAKYRFFIPYRLAYGEGGAGQLIPPFAALIFDVELIEVC